MDSRFYVPEDLMVKVDRASMAVSLEVRSPLLDHVLFDAAARIPISQRFDGRRGKLPFREALEADLGSGYVDRPKSGFAVPLGEWFKGPLREKMRDTLLDSTGIVHGLIPRKDVERLITMHSADRATNPIDSGVCTRFSAGTICSFGHRYAPATEGIVENVQNGDYG